MAVLSENLGDLFTWFSIRVGFSFFTLLSELVTCHLVAFSTWLFQLLSLSQARKPAEGSAKPQEDVTLVNKMWLWPPAPGNWVWPEWLNWVRDFSLGEKVSLVTRSSNVPQR